MNYALEVNRQGEIISRYPDKDNHFLDQTRYAMQDDMKQTLSAKTNPRAAMRIRGDMSNKYALMARILFKRNGVYIFHTH